MLRKETSAGPSSVAMRTVPLSTPSSVPRKLRRPATGSRVSIRASRPAKRTKSRSLTSGRSMPGEETSSVYAPGIGSSTSRSADMVRLIPAQSSTDIGVPSRRSAIICSSAPGPPLRRTRTTSKPMAWRAGPIMSSTRSARSDALACPMALPRAQKKKSGPKAHPQKPSGFTRMTVQNVNICRVSSRVFDASRG